VYCEMEVLLMRGPYTDEGPHKENRRLVATEVGITWQGRDGVRHFCKCRTFDISDSRLRVISTERLEVGSYLQASAEDLGFSRAARVRDCEQQGSKYFITLELRVPSAEPSQEAVQGEFADYYEVLELSPAAENETIHRVYRLLAARYHPDNAQTGDGQKFQFLQKAHEILSDPVRRAAYDAEYSLRQTGPMPIFELKDFVVGIDAEKNRRLGVLCLLYNRQRVNPDKPSLSLLEFEQLMTIPREHLMFTIWYLKKKQLLASEGGADFQITAEGVDFVESALPSSRLLQRLLRAPADTAADSPVTSKGPDSWPGDRSD
jgi:curved DNA-binding protein CbpA